MKKKQIIVFAVVLVCCAAVLAAVWKKHALMPKENPPVAAARVDKGVAGDNVDALLKNAADEEGRGELLKAQEALKNILNSFSSSPRIAEVQKRLENLNMRILFSALIVPDATTVYVVKEGDVLGMIAEEYRTTVEFVKRQNGLSSDVIRPGMRLRIWTQPFGVLVDKSQNILMLKSNGEIMKAYRVSTGTNNITPVGTFRIINRLTRPSWTHDGKLIPYGDPKNILGTRWMGFDVPSYGIHGTTQPESIGQQATAGCVRMLNQDVEELYDLLPVGTEAIIID